MIGSWIERYLVRLRAALVNAPPAPERPRPLDLAAIFAALACYMAFWMWITPSRPPDEYFFHEGGPIDWLSNILLGTAAILAGTAWYLGPRDGSGKWWLLCAAGMLYFSLDERFQFHEHQLGEWQKPTIGEAPFGLRNWNDAVVILYGLIAVVVLIYALPTFARYRRVRWFFVAAFATFALHTLFDSVEDLLPDDDLQQIAEESAKLTAGLCLALTFLHAALGRAADALTTGARPRASPVRFGVALAVVVVLCYGFFLSVDESWDRTLENKWGDPTVWMIAYLLAIAAIVGLFFAISAGHGWHRRVWLAASVPLMLLAFDVGTVACQWCYTHRKARSVLPAWLCDDDSLLDPAGPLVRLAIALGSASLLAAAWTSFVRHYSASPANRASRSLRKRRSASL